MSEPVLHLFSSGLLSKWGFNDGDAPCDVLDWLEDNGHGWRIDWHPVLTRLVEQYLVPALDQKVDLAHISTSHNPVRAQAVDGTDTEECWAARQPDPPLTPEFVAIPMSTVLSVAQELGALG